MVQSFFFIEIFIRLFHFHVRRMEIGDVGDVGDVEKVGDVVHVTDF